MDTILNIPVSEDVVQRLQVRAQEEGVDVETFASRSLTRESLRPSLQELLKPVQEAFEQSGMTDDELAEFLEVEKHEMRGVPYEPR